MHASFEKHTLHFKTPARTSRGAYDAKEIYIISCTRHHLTFTGEAAPLPDLSIDDVENMSLLLRHLCRAWNEGMPVAQLADTFSLHQYPAVQFALECIELQMHSGTPGLLFTSPFTEHKKGVAVNGLVWMSDAESMYRQAEEKIAAGYRCIKMKIGALDFDEECRLLEKLRKKYNAFQVELRVDANGAFHAEDALMKLKELSRFELHSIEQPVKAGQWDLMAQLCAETPLPIALDEDLIGVRVHDEGETMLKKIKPQYIILKPTLLGGFRASDAWIALAGRHQAGYWVTSALESNIGLNAIAQYAATLPVSMAQGLGTGALYTNNFESRSEIREGQLYFM